MSCNPVVLIIAAILILIACLLAGCYLYSLPDYCQPLPRHPRAAVIHYQCENP